MAVAAPTGERGSAAPNVGLSFGPNGDLAGSEREEAEAFRWPRSIDTIDSMLNDAQVVALTSAIMLPAQTTRISLDPNGMGDEVQLLADDLDLPLVGSDGPSFGRRRDALNHRKHFGRALSALAYGHAVFEIVGEIEQDKWRLRGLAPRPAWSIDRWLVDRQGRLKELETRGPGAETIGLEATRLALWTWGGEVGDPRGQSLLRSLYRPWLLKDRLMRIDAVSHERNAMGIPIGWLPEGGTQSDRDELLGLLSSVAAGEDTALIVPHGGDIRFRGVEGSTSNPLNSVKFCNEEMARALLGMIMNAGQTGHGTYSSSDNFMDLLGMFHESVLTWYCDLLTEQVVEPWVTFNLGEDAPAARAVWAWPEAGPDHAETEKPSGAGETVVPSEDASALRAGPQRPRKRALVASPERGFRRDLFPHEIAAKTDFGGIDAQHASSTETVVKELEAVRAGLAEVAADAVSSLEGFATSPERVVLAENAISEALAAERAAMPTDGLVKALESAHKGAIAETAKEAAAQGARGSVSAASYSEVALGDSMDLIGRVARQVLESALGQVRTGGSDPTVVSGLIRDAIGNLTNAMLEQAASAAVSNAELAGRKDQIRENPPASIYASELLDSNTCVSCEEIDGTEYGSLEDAEYDYPAGGYYACEGGDRCRGTLVVVYDTEGGSV